MSTRTLILGGGFGGIATAVELRRLLGADHEIVLVDPGRASAVQDTRRCEAIARLAA